jgi:hypothetical protein
MKDHLVLVVLRDELSIRRCSAGSRLRGALQPATVTRTTLTDRDVTEPVAAPTPAADPRRIHGCG